MFGAAYEILPRAMGVALPFPKLVRLHFWIFVPGIALFVVPLFIAAVEQGRQWPDAGVAFADANHAALKYLRISTAGQLLIFLGALLFASNLFVMAIRWKLALLKSLMAAIKAPLPDAEAKP
jgi:cytochrome c oxidase cbb3-type subunit 1